MCILTISCSKGKSTLDIVSINTQSLPMVHTEDATSLISDSGIIRFRVDAKVWDIYSEENGEQRWHFPEGIYGERFDSLANVEMKVKADTAHYFIRPGIWKLIGNVEILNLKQEKFMTSELYYDEKKGKIYSDSLVRVKQTDADFTVIGFESNQSMSQYRYYKIQPSVIYLKEGTPPVEEDTISLQKDIIFKD